MLEKVKKLKFVNIFWSIFYLLIFIILLKNGFSYLDPDFGWHLKAGEEVSLSGRAPTANLYNYTYTGDWVNHEWLSDLALYHFYEKFGYEAVVIFFALLIVITLIILNIFIYKTAQTKILWPVLAGLQLFGLMASLPHLGVRLQELAWLFVLGIIIIIHYYQKTVNWRYLLFLPLIMLAWANLHGSFLIGFFLLGSFLGIQIFLRLFSNSLKKIVILGNGLSWSEIRVFTIIIFFSFLATLINPYQLGLYEFLDGYRNFAYLSLIKEWLPQHNFPFFYGQLIYLGLGVLAVIFYFIDYRKEKKALDLWSLFLLISFLFLSFKSRRHFPLFFILSLPFLVNFNSAFFAKSKIYYQQLLSSLLIFCLILTGASQLLLTKFTNQPFSAYCYKYPCGAVSFLKNNQEYLEYNLFNSYGWGGFLIWELPEKKIFIDGRLPQVEFAGQTFIEEYMNFFQEEVDHEAKLESYNIRLILIEAKDSNLSAKKWEKIFFNIKDEDLKVKNSLRSYLDSSEKWQVIYKDNTAKIYFLENEVSDF